MRLLRDLVGQTLSERYRIVSRVAGGGMGEVFRGHDLLLDRPVAVKVLQPSLAADPELVERFKQEARAAARLNHPHIVAVHDWGSADEHTYYMVMEYVAGTDLREVLTFSGPVDAARAVQIVAAVCDALTVAHRVGLVHRDIKPENILIARDGTVKVTDFGIALVMDAELTMPGGSVPGTLRYLSPEQARGEKAGPPTDVWGAGALLFELLTGEPLCEAGGIETLQRRAFDRPRLPSELVPAIEAELDDIVEGACSPQPDERPDATDMSYRLRSIAHEEADLTVLLDDVTGDVLLPDMKPTTFVSGRHLRRRPIRKILVAVIAAIAMLLLIAQGLAALTAPEIVDVPRIAGLKLSRARVLVAESGLELQIADRIRSTEVPKGEVVSQSPERGELEEGRTVSVVVSRGLPLAAVPDLVGLQLRLARVRLNAAELDLDIAGVEYSLKDKGTVISQDPVGGKLQWGEQVAVVISRGPRPVAVPDVVGLELEQAQKKLREAGLESAVTEVYSSKVAQGVVIGTTPTGGASAPEGSEIVLEVSIGPRFDEVRLPDVRGLSIEEATAQLERLGLNVKIEESCPGGTTVVETHPIPGTMVKENSTIALFVC